VVESFGDVYATGDRARSVTIADRSQRLQAIGARFQERKHQILEVRWLPPDPNDRSRMIEPEPD
jgi:hypothetical protein